MLATGAITLSLATYCWPVRPAARRVRALRAPTPATRRAFVAPPVRTLLFAVLVLAAWSAFGLLVAAAALLVGWTAVRRLRARRALRQRLRSGVVAGEALSALVGCLHAGAHPAAAAESAVPECAPEFVGVLHTIAATSRLGGDVQRALVRPALDNPGLSAAITQLGQAWALVQRHGLPLAGVLEAVRRDLDHRARFAGQVHARMAGPRSSATVLAILPCLGVLLGEAMGARPLHVLFDTVIGQFLLFIGCALTCGGLLWSARLTERTVQP